jgi:PPK2 family polyphosphate:nucleotide phosphotransferase
MKHEDLLIRPGRTVRLCDFDPGSTPGFDSKADARDKTERDIERLAELQEVLAASRSHALLIVLQGMDSAGKDGTIKHVMSGVNPQGVDVHSFKTPTPQEEAHDFLWRSVYPLPERGRIGIFNRSYYEEVVVVRVHRELLALEASAPEDDIWAKRFEDINAFERHLTRSGTVILKFFLHLSKAEQRKRLLERLDDPNKNWKFSVDDVKERQYWDRYQAAYEQALGATSTSWAPWYVVPADRKWFVRVAIADLIVATLDSLGLRYPQLKGDAASDLEKFRAELEAEPNAGAAPTR